MLLPLKVNVPGPVFSRLPTVDAACEIAPAKLLLPLMLMFRAVLIVPVVLPSTTPPAPLRLLMEGLPVVKFSVLLAVRVTGPLPRASRCRP